MLHASFWCTGCKRWTIWTHKQSASLRGNYCFNFKNSWAAKSPPVLERVFLLDNLLCWTIWCCFCWISVKLSLSHEAYNVGACFFEPCDVSLEKSTVAHTATWIVGRVWGCVCVRETLNLELKELWQMNGDRFKMISVKTVSWLSREVCTFAL